MLRMVTQRPHARCAAASGTPVSVYSWNADVTHWDVTPDRLIKTRGCASVPIVHGIVRDAEHRAIYVMEYFPFGDLGRRDETT